MNEMLMMLLLLPYKDKAVMINEGLIYIKSGKGSVGAFPYDQWVRLTSRDGW
jgi:hypothetical protein